MYQIRNYAIGAMAVFAVSACDVSVLPDSSSSHKNSDPQRMASGITGSDFSDHLAREYLALAAEALAQDDNRADASAYIARSLRIQAGEDVRAIDPQSVRRNYWSNRPDTNWDDSAISLWEEVRSTVATHRNDRPAACASLQVLFDNWVEEEGEWTLHYSHPDEVRARIPAALRECRGSGTTVAATGSVNRFEVLFAFSSARLDDKALQQVRAAAREALSRSNLKRVRISGHTDRAGTEPYNDVLSQMRAATVGNALAAAGVPRSLLETTALGERAPRVQTKDGVKLQRNRRAVIEIEDK